MSTVQDKQALLLFDGFEPDREMGERTLEYDAQLSRRWQQIFSATQHEGAGGQAEAASVAMVLMMRAYLDIAAPRPPGNIQARQSISFANLPKPGERLRISLRCVGKEIRRERRYVELLAKGESQEGRPIFEGLLTVIWAA